jgi:hypothetical protein
MARARIATGARENRHHLSFKRDIGRERSWLRGQEEGDEQKITRRGHAGTPKD